MHGTIYLNNENLNFQENNVSSVQEKSCEEPVTIQVCSTYWKVIYLFYDTLFIFN